MRHHAALEDSRCRVPVRLVICWHRQCTASSLIPGGLQYGQRYMEGRHLVTGAVALVGMHKEKLVFRSRPDSWTPSSWPVVAALIGVGLLFGTTLGIDLVLGQRVARRTDDIVDNAVRSTDLVHDMRAHIRPFLYTPRDQRDLTELKDLINDDVRKYEALATYPGEHEEWVHLQALLQMASAGPRTETQMPGALVKRIDASVNRLVEINTQEVRASAAQIRQAHYHAFWSDLVVGAGTLVLVFAVAILLLRVLARQRRLVATRVQFLNDKNRELEAFAGRAAHDLRGPLGPIRGYADLILAGRRSPEDVARMTQRIRRGVDRMARVIDDMLALSTSGHPPPGEASTSAVVASLLEEMGPDLHEGEVSTDLAGTRVACHEGVLGQLLRNLIGNAIKFRAQNRPLKITIKARDIGSMVEISIEDNGVGMDPESARHAFEPFFRGRGNADSQVPGHGLGLAIVERTTHSLGGTCELSSAQDQGTRVVLRLPRA